MCNSIFLGPSLDCYSALILTYCTLANELERSGFGKYHTFNYLRPTHIIKSVFVFHNSKRIYYIIY